MLRYTYRPQRTDPPRSQLQQPQPQKEAPVSQIRDTVDDNINPALPFARSTMGIMVYSLLLRVMQDLYHQQYNLNYPLCKQSCRGSKWVSTHSCTNSRGPTRLLEGLYPAYLQSHDGFKLPSQSLSKWSKHAPEPRPSIAFACATPLDNSMCKHALQCSELLFIINTNYYCWFLCYCYYYCYYC